MARLLKCLSLLLFACSASAATVAERSAVQPGLWWNAARPGSGFELFAYPGGIAATWFTFDSNANPVWYTAQGELLAGTTADLSLRRHAWRDGRYAGSTEVGRLALRVDGPERVQATWTLGAATGVIPLTPFVVAAATPEFDRTGIWFDSSNSGWGLTLLEQGKVLGTTVYAYDGAGEPIWFIGSGSANSGVLALARVRGTCPVCTWAQSTSTALGELRISGGSDSQLVIDGFSAPTSALAPGVQVAGARISQLSLPASQRAADRQLAILGSESTLRSYLLQALETSTAYSSGLVEFSPAPPATSDASTTNLQEGGVDEAGLVKNDGSTIYTFAQSSTTLARLPRLRILPVTGAGASVGVPREVPLAGGSPNVVLARAGLYLDPRRLVAVTGSVPGSSGSNSVWGNVSSWAAGRTDVEIFDRTDPLQPISRWQARFDGHLVSSRMIGTRMYLVLRQSISLSGMVQAPRTLAQVTANRAIFDAVPTPRLLPGASINGAAPQTLIDPAAILVPPPGTQVPLPQFVTVIAIDIAEQRVLSSLAIIGSVEAVYASSRNLVLATARFPSLALASFFFVEPPASITDLHQIALGGESLRLVGTGSVEGILNRNADAAAFRFSEHGGQLRVVTSSGIWWGSNKNQLTILEPSVIAPGVLRTVSTLPNASRPAPLGKPGEQLYGTRFVGDRLYAVTFQTTDPLYVVDLSTPADPRIAGELEIPGYSEYLHALPGNLVLGVGLDARPAGTFAWFQGLQVSLFDVADPSVPRQLQRVLVGKRGSTSALLSHHQAFTQLNPPGGNLQLAFPVRVHDGVPVAGSGDNASYAWWWSGLLRYELRGAGADARLFELPRLLIDQAPGFAFNGSIRLGVDSAARDGRSVLFTEGQVYIGNGAFWHQRRDGSVTGPL